MLYDAFGKPIREVQLVIDEMLAKGINYRVVPKNEIDGYGSNHKKFSRAEIKYAGGWHTVAMFEGDDICVGEHVLDRFKPIIAAHEYGHTKGLTHQEIFRLELAAADEMARVTNDEMLKEDYIRWSSSREMFEQVRGNLGREAEQELWDAPETVYSDIKRRYGAEMVVRKEGDSFIQLD
jgi:hypothetical protein